MMTMRTVLDAPSEALDPSEQAFVAELREHGWFHTAVKGDHEGPGFSYTTGLWVSTGQPELLIFGMHRSIAHDVLWELFRNAKSGVVLQVRLPISQIFSNSLAYAFPVAKKFYRDYLGWSCWFYGSSSFPCLQIVWPDRSGVFPWEPGFEEAFLEGQADLTENGWQSELRP
jgi:hypothetical protein